MATPSYGSGIGPNTKRRGRFGVFGLLVCLLVVYAVVALLNPWALHIGGRWTPWLYWTGSGRLVTKTGSYPLLVTLFPAKHSSRLHVDGLRPTGGIRGNALLCTSPGVTQELDLSGTIYGGWWSTEGSLMDFRLLEHRSAHGVIVGDSKRGYFNLLGYWHGAQLSMNDRGEWSTPFHSSLRIEHASVTLEPGSKADFNAACASMSSPTPGQ
jgi:hypothetical protein